MKRILAATALAIFWSGSAVADSEVVRDFKQVAPATAVRQVRIEIPIAEIEIRNGSPDAVALSGTIRQRYDGTEEREWATEIVESTKIVMHVSGDVVFIRRETGPEVKGWRAKKSPWPMSATLAPAAR